MSDWLLAHTTHTFAHLGVDWTSCSVRRAGVSVGAGTELQTVAAWLTATNSNRAGVAGRQVSLPEPVCAL